MAPKSEKRIRVKVKEILQDIKAGHGGEALKNKYGLSQQSLQKIIGSLLQREMVTLADLKTLLSKKVTKTKTVSAKMFLALFRESSDDFYLMDKLNINVTQLQQIYDTLIENKALSEYEYYSRERKAPELEEAAMLEAEDSTMVNLYEEKTTDLGDYVMAAKNSSATPVTSLASVNIGYSSEKTDNSGNGKGSHCPNCGKPKTLSFQETCFHCGILFSKFKATDESTDVSVWRDANTRDIK